MFNPKRIRRIASQWVRSRRHRRTAGPLKDVSKLRFQAVFFVGPGGSGKDWVAAQWMKYMPGSPSVSEVRDMIQENIPKPVYTEQERSLSNLKFEKDIQTIEDFGYKVEFIGDRGIIPFRLYEYNHRQQAVYIPPEDWKDRLPAKVYASAKGATHVIYSTPKHEIPSYWRTVDPDVYKTELAGYVAETPGYVHEMSGTMALSYLAAIAKTGDPVIVNGTGASLDSMRKKIEFVKSAGYRVSLVYVYVPLPILLIQNALRSRKVHPDHLLDQWKKIQGNIGPLRGMVNKFRVIDNTNPKALENLKNRAPEINKSLGNPQTGSTRPFTIGFSPTLPERFSRSDRNF